MSIKLLDEIFQNPKSFQPTRIIKASDIDIQTPIEIKKTVSKQELPTEKQEQTSKSMQMLDDIFKSEDKSPNLVIDDNEYSNKSDDTIAVTLLDFAKKWAPEYVKGPDGTIIKENDPEIYANNMVQDIKNRFNVDDVNIDSNIFNLNKDYLINAVANQEGYYKSAEWNMQSHNRPTNLSQEWNNPGMLEFKGQDGATESREVLKKDGSIRYRKGRFAVFATEDDGFRALEKDIIGKQESAFNKFILDQQTRMALENSTSYNLLDYQNKQKTINNQLIQQFPTESDIEQEKPSYLNRLFSATSRGIRTFGKVNIPTIRGSILEMAGATKPKPKRIITTARGNRIEIPEITREEADKRNEKSAMVQSGRAIRKKAREIYENTPSLHSPKNKKEFAWGNALDADILGEALGQGIPTLAASTIPGIVATGLSGGNPLVGYAAVMNTAFIIESGLSYDEAVEYGLSPDEARLSSSLVGLTNAFLELLPFDSALKNLGLKRSFQKRLIKNYLSKRAVAQAGKGALEFVLKEAITEAAQEVTNVANEIYYKDKDDEPTVEEALQRINQAFHAGIVVSLLPGAASSIVGTKKTIDARRNVIKAIEKGQLENISKEELSKAIFNMTKEERLQLGLTNEFLQTKITREDLENAASDLKKERREERGLDEDSPSDMTKIGNNYVSNDEIIDEVASREANAIESILVNTDEKALDDLDAIDLATIRRDNELEVDADAYNGQYENLVGNEYKIAGKKYKVSKNTDNNTYEISLVKDTKAKDVPKKTNQQQIDSVKKEVQTTREKNAKSSIKSFEANTPSVRNKSIDRKVVSELQDISKQLNLPIVKKGKNLNKNELRNQIKEFFDNKEQDVAQKRQDTTKNVDPVVSLEQDLNDDSKRKRIIENPSIQKTIAYPIVKKLAEKLGIPIADTQKTTVKIDDKLNDDENLMLLVDMRNQKGETLKGYDKIPTSTKEFKALANKLQKYITGNEDSNNDQVLENVDIAEEVINEMEIILNNRNQSFDMNNNFNIITEKVTKDKRVELSKSDLLKRISNKIAQNQKEQVKKQKEQQRIEDIKEFKESLPGVSAVDKRTNQNWKKELKKSLKQLLVSREQFNKKEITEKNLIAAENNFTNSKKIAKKFATAKEINSFINKIKSDVKKPKKVEKKKVTSKVEQPKAYNEIRFKSTYKGKSEDRIHRKKDDGSWEFEVVNEEGNLEFVPIKSKAIIAKANKKLKTKDKDIEDAQRREDAAKDEEYKKDLAKALGDLSEMSGAVFIFPRNDTKLNIDRKIKALSIVGAELISRGVKSLKQFTSEMIKRYDNSIRRYIKKIFKASKEYIKNFARRKEIGFQSATESKTQYTEQENKEIKLRNIYRDIKNTTPEFVKNVLGAKYSLFSPFFSTTFLLRTMSKNRELKNILKNYELRKNMQVRKDLDAISPFSTKYENLYKKAYRIFPGNIIKIKNNKIYNDLQKLDMALANGDMISALEIGKKYNMDKEILQLRPVLKNLFDRIVESGYTSMNYSINYFPRVVHNYKKFKEFTIGKDKNEQSFFDDIIAVKERKLGRKLTEDEKADTINNAIAYSKKFNKVLDFSKRRSIVEVTEDILGFYDNSNVALIKYINRANDIIARQQFLGKGVDVFNTGEKMRISVGEVIAKLIKENKIKPENEEAAITIFNDYLNKKATGRITSSINTITYSMLLGSSLTAFLGTFSEFAVNAVAARLNPFRYAKQYAIAGTNIFDVYNKIGLMQDRVTMKKLGIETISKDLKSLKENPTLLSRLTGFQLLINGFSYLDRVNKEVLVNASIDRLRKQAQNWGDIDTAMLEGKTATSPKGYINRKLFGIKNRGLFGTLKDFSKGDLPETAQSLQKYKMKLTDIFESKQEVSEVIEDLKSGKLTPNILYLAESLVLDKQPLSSSEMPPIYNKYPKLRAFYALNSWTIKQISSIFEMRLDNIDTAKNKFEKAEANVAMAGYIAMLLAAQTSGTIVRALINGEELDEDLVTDEVTNNLLSMVFLSRYSVQRYVREQDAGDAIIDLIGPPVLDIGTNIIKDIGLYYRWSDQSIADNEESLKYGIRSKRYIPLIGAGLYTGWRGLKHHIEMIGEQVGYDFSAIVEGGRGFKMRLEYEKREIEKKMKPGSIAKALKGEMPEELTTKEIYRYAYEIVPQLEEIKAFETKKRMDLYLDIIRQRKEELKTKKYTGDLRDEKPNTNIKGTNIKGIPEAK